VLGDGNLRVATRTTRLAGLRCALVGVACLVGCEAPERPDAGRPRTDAWEALDAWQLDATSDAIDAPGPVTDTGGERDDGGATDAAVGPAAPCLGAGGAGHLQLTAAYWSGTDVYGDHLAELAPAVQAGHIDVAGLGRPLPDGVDVIVDLHWELFDYATHTIRGDIDERLDAVARAASPVLPRVRAFYLIDEPYLAGHEIPRPELEAAIARIESRFPGIPTYITFAHHCFDPASTDPVCVVPAALRGIPAGLDWVGFDWYNDSNDLTVADGHVPSRIATGVARIAALAPSARIIVIPETYTDATRLETTVVSTMHDYFAFAAATPAVFGIDFFLWADVPPPESFRGLHSLSSARAPARGFCSRVPAGCGETPDLIPVTQWYSAAPDHRYEPWVWEGRSSGYRVHGMAFALPPAGTPGTVPLVHCLVDRGASVDSFVTRDAACDGAPVLSPGVVIGGIFPDAQPGTVQLHRYGLTRPPWDQAYALSPSAPLPEGYAYSYPIGWVYPPSAL